MGRRAAVDGFDDLGVVDALQVHEVMPRLLWAELAMDDDQRRAFASHLDSMRLRELVRREAPTGTSLGGGPAQVRSSGGAGPVAATRGTVEHAEQWTDGKLDPQLEPGVELLPAPCVHADLAAPSALAAADEQGGAAVIEIGFGRD